MNCGVSLVPFDLALSGNSQDTCLGWHWRAFRKNYFKTAADSVPCVGGQLHEKREKQKLQRLSERFIRMLWWIFRLYKIQSALKNAIFYHSQSHPTNIKTNVISSNQFLSHLFTVNSIISLDVNFLLYSPLLYKWADYATKRSVNMGIIIIRSTFFYSSGCLWSNKEKRKKLFVVQSALDSVLSFLS